MNNANDYRQMKQRLRKLTEYAKALPLSAILWTAAAASFLILFLTLGSWIAAFGGSTFSSTPDDWASFGAFVGGVLAPTFALTSFLALWVSLNHQRGIAAEEVQRKDDLVYYQHAVDNLKRAYELFFENQQGGVPKADRLLWLTVARQIMTAKATSQLIATESIRRIYCGEEEYWRRKFYDYLKPTNARSFSSNANYFQADGVTPSDGIDERSIKVIYQFVEWPEDQSDPIDSVKRFSNQELEQLRAGRVGIRDHVERIRNLKSGDSGC